MMAKVPLTARQRDFLTAAVSAGESPHPIVRKSIMSGWRASSAWRAGDQTFTDATGSTLASRKLIEPIPSRPGAAATMKVRSAERGVLLGYAYRVTAAGADALKGGG